jgi:hypothetical protein
MRAEIILGEVEKPTQCPLSMEIEHSSQPSRQINGASR